MSLTNGQGLTLRLLLPHGSEGNVAPVIQTFTALTGVKVDILATPTEEMNTVLTLDAFSGAQSYDVALPATFGLPDLAVSEAILPLDAFAADHEPLEFRRDILFDIGDSFDGQTFGFQTDGDAYVMFYNSDMLHDPQAQARYADLYGVALERPVVWSELDRQMAFFHQPDQGVHGGLLFRQPSYLAWEWWMRFHANGVWPFSPDMEPQIAGDEGVGALADMIAATQSLCPEVHNLGLFDNWERYSRGDVYCNIGWGGSQKYFNRAGSNIRNKLVYGPTPGGYVDDKLLLTPYFNWGWNYVVVRNSPVPEIAYLFALFASTPEMSTLAVRQTDGFFDPFRPEHYADEGIRAAYTPEFLDVHRASLESAIPDLYLKDQSEYFRVLGQWLAKAMVGDETPQIAMQRVAERWQLITNSTGRQLQSDRWMQLRAKYPVTARRVLKDFS
ncbi:MAG: ABC transporter substrate-binding protein [Roseovarius sp.]